MSAEGFSRQVDVSVVLSLASLLIILSAILLMFDRRSLRDAPERHGARALLWAHVFYLVAAAGLELGRVAPFGLSAAMVIAGALGGLVAGYVAMESALMRRWKGKAWLVAAGGLAAAEGVLAALTGSLELVFVTSSVANGALALYFAADLLRHAHRTGFPSAWIMVIPFLGISAGYLGRLAMIVAGARGEAIVVASTAIGLVFPVAAMCWVFAIMSIRAFHMNGDLERLANTDSLTGIANRASFDRFMARLPDVERRRNGRRNFCLCIDMDRFKEINDSFGHEAGDAVLAATARRLLDVADAARDRVFRIGGDEFVLWHEATGPGCARDYAGEILNRLCEPVAHGGVALRVGVSIGVEETAPRLRPRDVIRRADIALYRSKADGRTCVTAYSEALGAAYDHRLAALAEFRVALEEDQLLPVFQPQFCARTLEVTGCEVLARWRHPTRGLLGPQDFVPLAEELGLLARLDRRMLDQALAAFHAWAEMGCRVPRISVNVSVALISDAALADELAARPDLPPDALSLEIVETSLVEDGEALGWKVGRLKDLGIGIEVDDFGTGHASLASVVALKPERIKIDRMFTVGIEHDAARRDLMAALVGLVHQVGSSVVVEGVEHAAQIDVVRSVGAAEVQGFALARPMEFDAMTAWLGAPGRRVRDARQPGGPPRRNVRATGSG